VKRGAALYWSLWVLALPLLVCSCRSNTPYSTQDYAVLKNSKEFEFEYSKVWDAIKTACAIYSVRQSNSEKGLLETDWVVTTSSEKYFEYTVNGFPRKKYLQIRLRYLITAQRQLGSVLVTVELDEEVENLDENGEFAGWRAARFADAQKPAQLIEQIELKLLSSNK
jgi:hypothetical protein